MIVSSLRRLANIPLHTKIESMAGGRSQTSAKKSINEKISGTKEADIKFQENSGRISGKVKASTFDIVL